MRNGNYILLEDSTDRKAISTPNEFEAERRICGKFMVKSHEGTAQQGKEKVNKRI